MTEYSAETRAVFANIIEFTKSNVDPMWDFAEELIAKCTIHATEAEDDAAEYSTFTSVLALRNWLAHKRSEAGENQWGSLAYKVSQVMDHLDAMHAGTREVSRVLSLLNSAMVGADLSHVKTRQDAIKLVADILTAGKCATSPMQ